MRNREYTNCRMCNRSIYNGENKKFFEEYWECDCCGKTICEDCVCFIDNIPMCDECYDENKELYE